MHKITGTQPFIKGLTKTFSGLPSVGSYIKQDTSIGPWNVKRFNLSSCTGYFSTLSEMGEGIALLKGDRVWMSISPMEIESHILPQHSASGTVVIFGLGLGMITLSLLSKVKVKKIYVVDIDRDLLSNFGELLIGESKRLYEDNISSGRLELVECDGTGEFEPEIKSKLRGADYMWVDIWDKLGSDEALSIVKHINRNLKPKKIDWWGMELDLITHLATQSSPEDPIAKKKSRFVDLVNDYELPISAKFFDKKGKQFYFEFTMLVSYISMKQIKKSQKKHLLLAQ